MNHGLELVAILFTLKMWCHYLYGVHVEVFTDHKHLRYVFSQKELNLKQRRWLELFKDYDMSILYHLGKASVVDVMIKFSMGVLLISRKARKNCIMKFTDLQILKSVC